MVSDRKFKMDKKLKLTYLADNFNILVRERIDTAPYAGYLIRFSAGELKLIGEVRDYLVQSASARIAGGRKSSGGGRRITHNSPEARRRREYMREYRKRSK